MLVPAFPGDLPMAHRRCVQRAALLSFAIVLGGCASAPHVDESGLPATGARRPEFFREPGPRAKQTIFSPLDLPTPGPIRAASGVPGAGYWQQQVNYTIDATLDAQKKAIEGHAVVTYINNSPDALPYLWLNLEQNLFKEDSLGSLSMEPGSRFGYHGAKGGLEIKSVRSVASKKGKRKAQD